MSDEDLKDAPPNLKAVDDKSESQDNVSELVISGAATTKDLANSLIGQTIDTKYEIESLIGSGGLGMVFKAKHIIAKRTVAIKVLLPGKHIDKTSIARFVREAKTAMGLKHPNIAGVQDIGMHDTMPFIVMEYVDGKPLDAVLKEAELEPKEKLSLLKQLCQAMEFARQNGVVHRDLKPSNIIITDALNENQAHALKVIDFGIARVVDAKEELTLTNTGDLFGTPAYMSPEQCMGEKVDHRSDIYSMGCISHELFTGSAPYSGMSTLGILNAHVQEEIPSMTPPKELAGIEVITRKALEKKKEDRYETAQAMLDQIDKLEQGGKLKYTDKLSSKKRLNKFARVLFISAIVFMLGLLAFVQYFGSDSLESLSERIRSNPKDYSAYIDRGTEYTKRKEYRYAISDLTKAIQINPNVAMAYVRKSIAERALKEYDAALKDANKGVELSQNYYRGYLERAVLYQQMGKDALAIKDFEKAVALNTSNHANNNSIVYTNLAALYIDKGDRTKAIENATKAIDLDIPIAHPYIIRARGLISLGDYQKAVSDLNQALILNPKSTEALWYRGFAYSRMGKLKKALADYNDYLLIRPESEKAKQLKAKIEQLLQSQK